MSTTAQHSKVDPTPQKPKSKVEPTPQPKAQDAETVNDIYSVFQQSLDKYFKEIRANASTYLQSVSDLQLEIIESRKKNVESAISLQKTMADKFGTNTKVPEESLNIATAFAEQTTKAWNFQNQLMLTSLETLSKNIHAFNDNSKTFAEVNGKLIDSWASIIKKKSQD